MEYIKAEQKINGCTLECSVTAKGESLSYAYYLYLNDQRIINTGYSTSSSISFPLEKFGRYHSTVFIRDPEGNKIIKELSPLDYWETHVLLVDSPFTKSAFSQLPQPVEISICPWNQRIETLPVPESFPNTSIDFLLLDLLGPASDFAASHAGMLQALRSADPAASLIPATPVQKELLEFLQKTKIFLEKLQKQYGTKKIILLEPLFPFENASEWQLNVNWVLEEIYSFSKTAGLHTIPLPGAVLPGRPKPACRSSNADIIYQQIEKYNREKYLPKAEIREISVCLEGNRLTATILYNGDVREGAVFHFYLLLDGRILVKELGMKQPVQSWELEQSGIYVV